MSVEKSELPSADLSFESRTQSDQLFDAWSLKVMGLQRVNKRLY